MGDIEAAVALLGVLAGWVGAGAIGVAIVGLMIFMIVKGKDIDKDSDKTNKS